MRIIFATGISLALAMPAAGQAAYPSAGDEAGILQPEPARQWRGDSDGGRGDWNGRGRWNDGDRDGGRDGWRDRDRDRDGWNRDSDRDRDRNDRDRDRDRDWDRDRRDRWNGGYPYGAGAYYPGDGYYGGNYGYGYVMPRYNDRDDNRRWDNGWRRDTRYDWYNFRRDNRDLYRPGSYANPYRDRSYTRLRVGLRLGQPYYNSRYWIADPGRYRLPPVWGNYRWVRYYDDVLLIDTRSGMIEDAVYGFFW